MSGENTLSKLSEQYDIPEDAHIEEISIDSPYDGVSVAEPHEANTDAVSEGSESAANQERPELAKDPNMELSNVSGLFRRTDKFMKLSQRCRILYLDYNYIAMSTLINQSEGSKIQVSFTYGYDEWTLQGEVIENEKRDAATWIWLHIPDMPKSLRMVVAQRKING